jgi:hypothetical protein
MHLNEVTDALLEEAIRFQTDEFDTHDVIFWLVRNCPWEYAADLHKSLEDDGDPFDRLHTAISHRLVTLKNVVQQQHRKRVSLNVRGRETACEVWRRVS